MLCLAMITTVQSHMFEASLVTCLLITNTALHNALYTSNMFYIWSYIKSITVCSLLQRPFTNSCFLHSHIVKAGDILTMASTCGGSLEFFRDPILDLQVYLVLWYLHGNPVLGSFPLSGQVDVSFLCYFIREKHLLPNEFFLGWFCTHQQ